MSISCTKRFNDPEWKLKNTEARKSQGREMSRLRNDPEWIKKHQKNCSHCGIQVDAANFARHHGDNCKKRIICHL
jgi:hypothetical protein